MIARYPGIEQACQELESHGFHLRIADASLGGIYPVMSVTLINPEDGSVFASFGAHPSFEVALERTVTELLQGRRLDQLDVFQPASFDEAEIASSHNLEMHFIDSSGVISYDFFKNKPDYEFADWDFGGSTESEYQYLVDLVHQSGHDIYISDYQHLDVYACRILVPGMSDIYPVDEIVWNNNNDGALFREGLLSLTELTVDDWQDIYQALEEGGHNDAINTAEFIGIAPDKGTLWANMRIGELKALLALAIQSEDAKEWINWSLHLDQQDAAGKRKLRCIQALLDIKWGSVSYSDNDNVESNATQDNDSKTTRQYADYTDSLALMYGAETVKRCIEIVEGRIVFDGLHCPGLSLEGFNTHQKLLEGYQKLQAAKRSNWC